MAQLTCALNIKWSMDKPEAVDDIQGFDIQQDKGTSSSLTFPEGFPDSEADIEKVHDCCTAELTVDDLG